MTDQPDIARRPCIGGQGKDQITVLGHMRRHSGPPDSVMGGNGDTLAFGLG